MHSSHSTIPQKSFFLLFFGTFFLISIQNSMAFSGNANIYAGESTNADDSLLYVSISVNGDTAQQRVTCLLREQAMLINAQTFCDMVGAQYFPIGQHFGLIVQYGKIISFALNQYPRGFAALKMIDMLPPTEAFDDTVMAPVNFLAQAIDGQIAFNEAGQHLAVTVSPPMEIGDIIPEAQTLANALAEQDYMVQQGAVNRVNAIDLYIAGYQEDCNGNNANYPYLMMQTPPCPEKSNASAVPMFYTMRSDEAFILIGQTPPVCMYYSYRSYLYSRWFEDASPKRTKIYASLGDTQSLYNMTEAGNMPDNFNRFFMLISAADKKITDAIRTSALNMGIDADDIYVDVIPADTVHMGLDVRADFFNFLHRAVLFNNPDDEDAYTVNPPLEFLRVTPNTPVDPEYLADPQLRTRGTGLTEFRLNEGLDSLRQHIINRYIADYDTISLVSYQWIPEGYQAIATRFNARGENRDALYLRTPFFQFNQHDIIVVFGVNHAMTHKATYCNAGILGAEAVNGLGGVNNIEFKGSAREFLNDSILADSFYVWKFARTALDDRTYVIPPDSNQDYTGIDYGALSVLVFRSYVEPATSVGPDAAELIMDRAIIFRPKATSVINNDPLLHSNFRLYQNYPNPFNPATTITYELARAAHVKITIFDVMGQDVREIVNSYQLAGQQQVIWNGKNTRGQNVSSGIYYYKLETENFSSVRKMIFIK